QSRGDEAGLTGDEDDAAPVLLQHPRKIGTRQPGSAEYVDFEVPSPILVGDIDEILDLVDAEIIDEDIHEGTRSQQGRSTIRRRRIGQDAFDVAATSATNAPNCLVELRLGPAGDDHLRTFDGQLRGDRKADTASRSGDECRLV